MNLGTRTGVNFCYCWDILQFSCLWNSNPNLEINVKYSTRKKKTTYSMYYICTTYYVTYVTGLSLKAGGQGWAPVLRFNRSWVTGENWSNRSHIFRFNREKPEPTIPQFFNRNCPEILRLNLKKPTGFFASKNSPAGPACYNTMNLEPSDWMKSNN